jgi:threonine dehydrogenase-like Zn-dependent dehydrogenase
MKELLLKNCNSRGIDEYLVPMFNDSNNVTIRITKTTICEIDVHISKGDKPEMMERLILEHKGIFNNDEEESSYSVLSVNDKAFITYHRLRNL